MLKRLALRDFVIVPTLELEFGAGFSALTGETGAGKSILIDALQLVLGARGDAGVVREGAPRAEVSAEFDALSAVLCARLDEAGIDRDDGSLLLRRTIDAQGKSRAWINGSAATVAQLREFGEHLLDIHGQHAWQGLTRPESVRALLDAYAGFDGAPLAAAFGHWRAAHERLEQARGQQTELERERERLAWQINELEKLGPTQGEWPELEAEHRRLSHAQSIIDALQLALDASTEADTAADARLAQAIDALDGVLAHDAALAEPLEVLRSAQAQLQDAAHTLAARLRHGELDPARLTELDARLSAWMSLARRFRRPPEALPALLAQWQAERAQLDAATDLAALERELAATRTAYEREAKVATQARRAAVPQLGAAVSTAMQQLGMAGGRFEVALEPLTEPQRFGLESIEFRVAGHAGATPRALAKVASGGELSRIALAISVTTSELAAAHGEGAGTLIFDEVDAGVGGTVADTVGALMKRLGAERQVLAVTHLPQVAACADHHLVVSKRTEAGCTHSGVQPVVGPARISELARMLGGEGATSLAHAQALLSAGAAAAKLGPRKRERA